MTSLYERVKHAAPLLPSVSFLKVLLAQPFEQWTPASINAAEAILKSYEGKLKVESPPPPPKQPKAKRTTAPAHEPNHTWRTERRMPEPPLPHNGSIDRTGSSYPRRILASVAWIVEYGRVHGFSDMETAEEVMLEIQQGKWV